MLFRCSTMPCPCHRQTRQLRVPPDGSRSDRRRCVLFAGAATDPLRVTSETAPLAPHAS